MKEVKKPAAKKAAPKAKKAVEPVAEVAKPVAQVAKPVAEAAKPVAKAPAKPAAAKKHDVTPEQRYRMIQDAAYFIAERHGFNGDSAYFWSLAEAEVNSRLG